MIRGPLGRSLAKLVSSRSAQAGALLLGVFAATAILAPWIAPADPMEQSLGDRNRPPWWMEGDSKKPRWSERQYWLGTDDLGRDVLSRVLHGGRFSLTVGVTAVGLSLVLGVPLGAVAGFAGGRAEVVVMRVMDVMLAFPSILLAIAIVGALGPSLENVMLAVGFVGIPAYARQARASVLTVKETEYVQASRAVGASPLRVLCVHVLPNCVAPLLILASLGVATAILDAAGLSFLGLGSEPGTPEWGAMLSEGTRLLMRSPWAAVSPGLAIACSVLGFNLLGDGLRDALDPRSTSP